MTPIDERFIALLFRQIDEKDAELRKLDSELQSIKAVYRRCNVRMGKLEAVVAAAKSLVSQIYDPTGICLNAKELEAAIKILNEPPSIDPDLCDRHGNQMIWPEEAEGPSES